MDEKLQSLISLLSDDESVEGLVTAYNQAKEKGFEMDAAMYARKIRNLALKKTDEKMSLDRLKLDTSSALALLSTLKNIFNGSWAKYRQALRDIPQQKGFPFNIEFPDIPED